MYISKDDVIDALDELSSERLSEVLDFVLFLKQRKQNEQQRSSTVVLKKIPIHKIKTLTGLVSWGGDALVDAERIYES